METEYELLIDLVAALSIALVGGWVASRLGLSAVVGYIAAGLVISPFTPGFVGDTERIRLIADIGVVLIMFGIGVQFSLRDVAAAGAGTVAAAGVQVGAITAGGLAFAALSDWTQEEALYAGAAAALSSSTLVVKLLSDRGETRTSVGRLSVSWAVSQDLAAVVVVAVLVAVSQQESAVSSIGIDALKALGFVAGVVIVGIRPIPILLNRISEFGSRELFVVAIAVLALGTAILSEVAGLSLAIGAFLAGIIVSESDIAHRVLGELLPTRDVFGVLFFVSVGMLIDPEAIADQPFRLVALLVLMIVIKGSLIAALARGAGYPAVVAVGAGVALAQAGEFSFVFVRLGVNAGVLAESTFSLIVSATAISMALTPLVWRAGTIIARQEERAEPHEEPRAGFPMGRRAVVCGYGEMGRFVTSALARRFPVVVVEQDARVARTARDEAQEVIVGDASHTFVLERANLADCRVLVVTIPDPFAARLIVERARQTNPGLDVITRALNLEEADRLRRSGASETVVADREVGLEMIRHALHRFGVDQRQALSIVQRLRRS